MALLTAPYYQQLEQADGQPWPEDAPARVDRYNALLHQVAAASGGRVVVARPRSEARSRWALHPHHRRCGVRFADGIHVTPAGALLVSPWLLTQSAALGTANRAAAAAAASTTTTRPG